MAGLVAGCLSGSCIVSKRLKPEDTIFIIYGRSFYGVQIGNHTQAFEW